MIEIKGIEKTSMSKEEVERAIKIISSIIAKIDYVSFEYLAITFVDEYNFEKIKNANPNYVEVEEGLLVYDGSNIIIKCNYLAINILEKLFLGLLVIAHYNTFFDYGIKINKKILKENFFLFLSLIYG